MIGTQANNKEIFPHRVNHSDARSSAYAETGNHLWSRHLRQYRPNTQLTAAPNVFAMLAIPTKNQMSKPSAAMSADRTASEDNGRIVAAANALTKSDTYAAASIRLFLSLYRFTEAAARI